LDAGLCLINLIYYIPNEAKRRLALDMIVDDFAKSNVANFKRVYIEFCIHALNVTSHSFFKANLLPSLMALAKDKSVPVKLRFLKRVVPILNDTLGACDSSLTMELV